MNHPPQFEDPRLEGVALSLGDHLRADLGGSRSPVDEPEYLAIVLQAFANALTEDQQRRVASALGFREVP